MEKIVEVPKIIEVEKVVEVEKIVEKEVIVPKIVYVDRNSASGESKIEVMPVEIPVEINLDL